MIGKRKIGMMKSTINKGIYLENVMSELAVSSCSLVGVPGTIVG